MHKLPQQRGQPTAGDQRSAQFGSQDHQAPDIQQFAQPLDASWSTPTPQTMFSQPTFYPATDPESQQRQQYAQYQNWVNTYDHEQAQQNRVAFMQQQQQHSIPPQSRTAVISQNYSLSGAFDFPNRPPYQQPSSAPVFDAQQQGTITSYPQQYSQHQPQNTSNNVYYDNYGRDMVHVTPSASADSFVSGTSNDSIPSIASTATFTPSPSAGVINFSHCAPSHSASSLSPAWPEGVNSLPQQSSTPSSLSANVTSSTAVKRPAQNSKSISKTAASSRVQSRKRQRKNRIGHDKDFDRAKDRDHQYRDEESESESDDGEVQIVEGGISVGTGAAPEGGKVTRPPGACSYCKKLKMKCDFPKKENTCRRCKSTGHVCIVEGRKRRIAPNKREYLLAQIRQKDAIIESLLKQIHNPYTATPLSIASYRMAMSPSDENNRDILSWLDRLRSSLPTSTTRPIPGPSTLQNAGGSNPNAFSFDSRPRQQDGHDSEGESPVLKSTSVHQKLAAEYGFNPANSGQDDDDDITTAQGVEKLQSLPDENVPLGLIANLSLDDARTQGASVKQPGDGITEDTLDEDIGVANKTYFLPGPASDLKIRALMIEQHSPPEILVHGLVSPNDVEKLFKIFYERLNPFISLLDPMLHTPASTFARCPFLFTAICAVASRYYTEKSEIYPIAMHFAKHAAANALIDGWKSVELCQAYILMSTYAVPARRWEEDRSWLYTGLAIRIATDLNLHQQPTHKPATEKQEREALNRTRVWMICFNLDRSTATQFGKPSTIKEDFTMRNSKDWYKRSKYNHPYDIHLCGYTALLRIVARFHDQVFSDPDTPTGLNKRVNFRDITLEYDAELSTYQTEWEHRFEEGTDKSDEGASFRCVLLPFLVEYSRLVMFSFGFQQAFQRGMESNDEVFFTKCLTAAKNVIRLMIEKLAPSGYMRYAPDGHFVFTSFASAFLLKLLKPEFSTYLSKPQETEVFNLIGRLIQTLSSNEIAIDDKHTPKLYARFLASLLSRHRRDGATVGRLHPQPPPSNRVENAPQGPSAPSTSTFSFTSSFPAAQNTGTPSGSETGSAYHGYAFNAAPAPSNTKSTPIYRPEATFTVGSGPIQFGSDSDLLGLGLGMSSSDEEMLASMQVVTNPDWWGNVMMPGFSWPLDSPNLRPSSSATTQLSA